MMYVIDVMFNVNGLYMFMMYNDVIGYCDDPIGLKKNHPKHLFTGASHWAQETDQPVAIDSIVNLIWYGHYLGRYITFFMAGKWY